GPRWPVVAYGESYGAFLALQLASVRPDLFRGVIAISPFASLSRLRAVASPPVRQLVDLLAAPAPEATDLLRADLPRGCPVLLAHGSEDRTIPVQQSRELAASLRDQGYVDGRDLWLLELPGEGHVLSGREARRRLYHAITRFLSSISATTGSGHPARGRAVGPAGGETSWSDAQDTVWQVGGLAHAPEPLVAGGTPATPRLR
ncbi:MAG: alpha/beta hydrolase family protein, partial [Nitriliruptorales bacterium]